MRACDLVISVGLLASAATAAAAPDAGLAAAVNRLGLELQRQTLRDQPGANFALSPYSIECGLALTAAGAAGATKAEMDRVLGLPADDAVAAAWFFAQRSAFTAAMAEGHAAWHFADRLFGEQSYRFYPEFLRRLRTSYDAPLETLDLVDAAPAAADQINAWVSGQTAGKISHLLTGDDLNNRTRLVLVNALYLKVAWEQVFEKSDTRALPFYRSGQETFAVRSMQRTFPTGYWKRSDFTAVTVPYAAGSNLQLVVVLPAQRDGLLDVIGRLSEATLASFARPAPNPETLIALALPRFRLEGAPIALGSHLRSLGMTTVFDHPPGSADLSRMGPRAPGDYLFLSDVFHQAWVDVNETGTEAAAATDTVTMRSFAAREEPIRPVVVKVDHPFFFAIQDRKTGLCLLIGTVFDPRTGAPSR